MNIPFFMGCIADVLQFVVAVYALRLNRLFGTARVGWSLFFAFSLLALLHLIQSLIPSNGSSPGTKTELVYSIISLLLLTGMVHMEILLKERIRVASAEQQMRVELESEVKRKTSFLTNTIEELQSEIEKRRRMEAEVEKSNTQLLIASRRAEMAEIAASVLCNVGKTLKSVSVSTGLISDQMRQSKIANVVRVGAVLRGHAADMGDFMAHDPRGQKLHIYIAQLAEHLANEQTILSNELESIKRNIKEILVMQQNYAQLAGVADMFEMSNLADGERPWTDTQFLCKFQPQGQEVQNSGMN
jgi:hypothetical protein